jgi:hypothetical protein
VFLSGQIKFEVGEYSKRIMLQLYYDSTSTTVALKNSITGQLGLAACSIRYHDISLVQFHTSELEVMETVGSVNVVLLRSGGKRGVAVVRLTSSPSSALTAGKLDELVAFQDGEFYRSLSLPIQDSDEFETRSFKLSLINTTTSAQTSSSKLTVTVRDKGDVSLPASPTVRQRTTTGGMIGVSLQSPSFIGGDLAYILSYGVRFRRLGDTTWKAIESWSTTIDVYDLTSLTLYEISAAVRNQQGWSNYSPAVLLSTTDVTVPDPIWTLMVVKTTGGSIFLEWQDPLDKGGSPILEYRLRVLDNVATEVQTLSIPNGTQQVEVGDLNAWTDYNFLITPVNKAGPGATTGASASTTYTTIPDPPPGPRLVNASGGMLHLAIVGPVNCGGTPLLSYALYMARFIAGDLQFQVYASEDVQSKSGDGVVGTVGINGLLFNSIYVFRVAFMNAQVRC